MSISSNDEEQEVKYFYRNKRKNLDFFESFDLIPHYDKYAKFFFHPGCDYRWKVRMGDAVAVALEEDKVMDYNPFSESWCPAEVLSIYSENPNEENKISFELRWLYREVDLKNRKLVRPHSTLKEVFKSNHVEIIDSSLLIGPVKLVWNEKDDFDRSSYKIPVVRFYCCQFYDIKKHRFTNLKEENLFDSLAKHSSKLVKITMKNSFETLKKKLLEGENTNSVDDSEVVMDEIPKDMCVDDVEYETENRIILEKDSFYTNKSTKNAYYENMKVIPPSSMFSKEEEAPKEDSFWEISMGDIVAIHLQHLAKDLINYPFVVPWWPAEILFIFKEESVKEVNIEVRWLYRRKEMANLKKSFGAESPEDLEEVFETDHVDVCLASSILSPVRLFSSPKANLQQETKNAPCGVDYCCYRYWSVRRGTFMPCGGLETRAERGRMYSLLLKRDEFLKSLFNEEEERNVPLSSSQDLTKLYLKAISKLTLTSASLDAVKSEYELPCRQGLHNKIYSFLHSSVTSPEDGIGKLSFFIAGPPGTGKTACVLNVVSKLKEESSKGKFPSFDFVTINGMELAQHPTDAYSMLWEAISTQKKTPPQARALLELFFNSDSSSNLKKDFSNILRMSKSSKIILLLDEIDYLVTKEQFVLYNFFNWPSSKSPSLIVIGISNTINLPQRLRSKVESRLGVERCIFNSYTKDEISIILRQRLACTSNILNEPCSISVFHEDAFRFASLKAAYSGDIRSAFQICRNAAEHVLDDIQKGTREGGLVQVKDVQRTSREMFSSPFTPYVEHCPVFEALLIVSLASLKKETQRETGLFGVMELFTKMEGVAGATGDPLYLPMCTFYEFNGILNRIAQVGTFFILLCSYDFCSQDSWSF